MLDDFSDSGFQWSSKKGPHHILCISPSFVPMADSEAFCGAKMVIALRNCGIDVTVLYFEDYVSRYDTSELWNLVRDISVGVSIPASWNRLRSVVLGIKYRAIAWSRWVGATILKAMVLHSIEPFDIVYSRSLPIAAAIAGYWTSKTFKIPWIANIDDPWDWHLFPDEVRINASFLYSEFSKYWLRKTLRTADLVTFPSTRMRDYLSKVAGIGMRSEIIPHIGHCAPGIYQKGFFNLVHAGKIGVNEITGRSSRGLLKGLSLFLHNYPEARHNTRLIFVGPSDPQTRCLIKELSLTPYVIDTERVNYEESLKYISLASVCVLIEGKMREGIYLPSKMADYIVNRKPVLAMSPNVGVISDMLPCRGLVRVDQEDVEGIAKEIGFFYEKFRQGILENWGPSGGLVKQFEAKSIAEKFLSAVWPILKGRFQCSR